MRKDVIFVAPEGAPELFKRVAAALGEEIRPAFKNMDLLPATQLAYSAGKAAVIGMTKTLAKEFGRYNVTVNCVAYGHLETRLTEALEAEAKTIEVKGRELKAGLSPDTIALGKMLTPLGRAGTLEEAAGAVYLFCIPEADFITGQVLHCSGGLIL